MGKHAAPKTGRYLTGQQFRRAAAVSSGTLILCLGAGAPALASTIDPTPVTDTTVTTVTDTVTDTTSADTLTDPPLPQPVDDLVKQVSDTTGIQDPLDPTAPTGTHHKAGDGKTSPQVNVSKGDRTSTSGSAPTRHHTRTTAYAPSGFAVSGLRAMTGTQPTVTNGLTPAVADTPTVTRIAPAAGSHPIVAWPHRPNQEDTGRLLLVAIATLILGGLASGHIKLAQGRIAGL